MKTKLESILAPLSPDRRDRIAAALELMAIQARGCERFRARAHSMLKEDSSPVTVADLLHQTQFQQMLARRFPEDALISEEPRSLQQQSLAEAVGVSLEAYGYPIEPILPELPEHGATTWIMDPIDGTKGYLAGRYYAIAAGFFEQDEPIFAAMAVPAAHGVKPMRVDRALAFAIRGMGAWAGQISESGETLFERIETRLDERPNPLRISVSLEHGGGLADRLAKVEGVEMVAMDSQAKYLGVALGDIDIYMRERRSDGKPDLMWDHMPGGLIAREAGCDVRTFGGEPVQFAPRNVVELGEGFACFRGRADGPVWPIVQSIAR